MNLAQQLIEREKELRTGYLDLGRCGLTELPDLSELEWLETLVVSNEWWDEEKGRWVRSQNSGEDNFLSTPPIGYLPQNLQSLILGGEFYYYWPVYDLHFLSPLANLTSLNLNWNQISDLDYLKGMTKLTSLDLSYNLISNGEPLRELTDLKLLNIHHNEISDGNFLENLTNLRILNLGQNKIKNTRFLWKLTQLTSLNLESILEFNKISDVHFLENLTKLNLSVSQITNVNFLKSLTNLTSLKINIGDKTDCVGLENLTELTSLDLNGGKISNTRPLSKLVKITSLSIGRTRISDWRFLEKLPVLTSLNLWGNNIRNGSFLQNLKSLNTLRLSRTQISDWEFLKKVCGLTSLSLSDSQINDWSFFEKLTSLTSLNLRNIKITDGSFLNKLTKLTHLGIEENHISDGRFLESLTNLTSLNLQRNLISDGSFLEKLPHLTWLNISHNQISDLEPLLHLIQKGIPIDLQEFVFKGIGIYGNPLTNPPIEIVEKGNAAIIEYFRQKEATGAELLMEAKLILLGDGRAGKTSLANRLLGKDLPAEADRTQGVDIIIGEYAFPVAGGGTFQLNIWDFAGQDKYKPLHQFFYTESSLYVMVAESGNSGTDYDDWFQTAELFGEGSPLLLALNEFRDGTGLGSFDVELWKKRFPNLLKEVFSVNLGTQRGMEELRHHIHLLAQTLPHTRYEFPKNWAAVRRELESRRSENFIPLQEYLRICRDNQLPERDSALILSSVLHKIGVCLHYQKSELLRQYVILNNEWATGAVYQILEDPVVAEEKRGFFDWNDLRRIWHDAAYCDMQPQLLELMQQFKMAYPLPNGKEYVAPPLLSPAPPTNWEWPAGEPLAMYVEYEFMPKLLMTQFIVSRYMDIAEGRTQVWRNGVVLRWPDALAEVVKSKSQGRDAFLIRVQGKGGKGLLTAILKTLRDLHEEYKGIRPHEIIPCPCSGCRSGKNRQHYFDFRKLQNWWERGTRERDCDESGEFVDIGQLLGDNFLFEKMEIGRPLRMREVASPGALERQGLEESLHLMIQKLNRIREALAIENDPSAKFKYEKQIESLEQEIAEVRGKLRRMNG